MNYLITFRSATSQDRDKIISMLREVDNSFYPPLSLRDIGIEERVDFVLKRENSAYILCEFDETIVGIVGYDIHGEWAYINLLAVRLQYRGMGIGRLLVQRAERELRQRGVKHVKVCTWSTNEGAIRLYRSLGYDVEEVLVGHRGKGVDTHVFMKLL